jgi:hypothetical protein
MICKSAAGISVLVALPLVAAAAAMLFLARSTSPSPRKRAPLPDPGACTWHEAARLSDRSVQDLPRFIIHGPFCRIRWSIRPRPGIQEPYLKVRVRYAGGGQSDLFSNATRPESDECVLPAPAPSSITVFSHHDYTVAVDDCTTRR